MTDPTDPDDPIVEEVRQDLQEGDLSNWFQRDGHFETRRDLHAFGPIGNDHVRVVAWTYEATPDPEVWIGAEERGNVVIHGATFVETRDDGELLFSRYIDWHDVLQQLGVAAAGRVAIPPRADAAG